MTPQERRRPLLDWFAADTVAVEALAGVLNVGWGLWLGLFNTPAQQHLFLETPPVLRWSLAVSMMALGGIGWIALYLGNLRSRTFVAVVNAILWTFFFAVVVLSDYRLPATPVDFVFMLLFSWCAARLRLARQGWTP